VSERLEALVEKLEWFVDQASVTRNEKDLADHLESRLSGSSGHLVHRWRDGLVVVPKGAEPKLLLAGHLDTVPPSPEQTRKRAEGKVYGCGTSDMKAGLAVMLELLEEYPAYPIGYIFYDREEGPVVENGLKPLLASVQLPKVPTLVLEPTTGEIQVGCVGSFHLDVTFRGKRAHAARPWQGENALYLAAPFLQYLAARKPDEIVVHGQTFRQVITPTILSTHTLSNAVPGEITMNLNGRFAPGSNPESLIEEVKREAGPKAEVVLKDLAQAGMVCHDDPLLAPWIEAEGLQVAPKQAWTDVAQLTELGFPAVNFGPGEPSQAHQPDEWCPESGLTFCFEKIQRLVQNYLL
jgi:succinyl-diaminopimelate desuccinylase